MPERPWWALTAEQARRLRQIFRENPDLADLLENAGVALADRSRENEKQASQHDPRTLCEVADCRGSVSPCEDLTEPRELWTDRKLSTVDTLPKRIALGIRMAEGKE